MTNINQNEIELNYDEILKKKKCALFFKRIFDICASFFGLVFCMIPFIIIAIIIKCTSKGPVFYRQVRIARGGKEFRIFKFRTMVVDADKKGLQITTTTDSRITKIGSILRKTKVDELPQLINVFIGQMSFVGPRPEVPFYVNMYDERQRNILKIKPGITDKASIEFRNENDLLAESQDPQKTYIEEIMPKKIELNLEYIPKMNVFTDIGLIFKTFYAIIKK